MKYLGFPSETPPSVDSGSSWRFISVHYNPASPLHTPALHYNKTLPVDAWYIITQTTPIMLMSESPVSLSLLSKGISGVI